MRDWDEEISQWLIRTKPDPAREAELVTELVRRLDEHYDTLRQQGATPAEAYRITVTELNDGRLLKAGKMKQGDRYLWLIALLGVIVPQRLRADWRQEWEAELRYRETLLAEWGKLTWQNKLDLLRRSVGAFWDALWLQPQRWEDEMLQDLRYGVRMLLKHKGFTLIAVLTLALGIGANTTVFSLINAVLLKPISGYEPERLVGIYSQDTTRTDEYRSFSHPNYTDLREQKDVFEDVLAISFLNAGVTEGDMTRSVTAVKISTNYFSVFGVSLAQGRTFLTEEETQPAPVAIVSYRWWQQHGAQPNLIGQSLRVNGHVVNIVGIAPQGFTGTNAFFSPDLFLPLSFALPENKSLQDRTWHDLMIVGRLKPGVTMEAANARLQVVSKQLAAAYPGANHDQLITIAALPRMAITTAPSNDRAMIATIGVLTQGLSSLVLLIACLNLANMLLARGTARRKEFAVRQALGARAGRLVRQLLTEGFLLALLGGIVGVALAAFATDQLIHWMLQMIPFSFDFNPWPDVRVLGATLVFSLLATLFFALGPALKTVRLNLNAELKENAANVQASRRRLFATRHLLVIGQVALSLCLLVAAGLASRGAIQAIGIHPGFDLDRGFYLRLDGSLAGYNKTEVHQLYRRVTERVSSLPGVAATSVSMSAPFGVLIFGQRVQQGGMPFPPPTNAATPAQGKAVPANYNVVGTDYFRTLGVSLLQGREFRTSEFTDTAAPRVAIISATLAEKLWPGESALGRSIQLAGGSDADNRGSGGYVPMAARPQELFEIVGIVPPYKDELLREDDSPKIFLPFAQHYFSEAYLNVRAAQGVKVETLIRTVREEVHRLDPKLPMLEAKSMRIHFATSVAMWLLRMGAILFAIFGSVALLLSLIGVYGVNAFMVARRTREIGIRMALGADRRTILRLLLREGVRLTSLGLAFGSVLAGIVAWAMRGILFSVSPFDPLVFGVAIAVLAGAALLACYLPARRATKVDPLSALRQE